MLLVKVVLSFTVKTRASQARPGLTDCTGLCTDTVLMSMLCFTNKHTGLARHYNYKMIIIIIQAKHTDVDLILILIIKIQVQSLALSLLLPGDLS